MPKKIDNRVREELSSLLLRATGKVEICPRCSGHGYYIEVLKKIGEIRFEDECSRCGGQGRVFYREERFEPPKFSALMMAHKEG